MTEDDRIKYLRVALFVVGLLLVVGLYLLTVFWPAGYSWHEPLSEQMIIGIYATLGVFLIRASETRLHIEA